MKRIILKRRKWYLGVGFCNRILFIWRPYNKNGLSVWRLVPYLRRSIFPFFRKGEHGQPYRGYKKTGHWKREKVLTWITGSYNWRNGILVQKSIGNCGNVWMEVWYKVIWFFFRILDEKTTATKELAVKEEEFRRSFKHAAIGMLVMICRKLTKANLEYVKILDM